MVHPSATWKRVQRTHLQSSTIPDYRELGSEISKVAYERGTWSESVTGLGLLTMMARIAPPTGLLTTDLLTRGRLRRA